jgi:transposase
MNIRLVLMGDFAALNGVDTGGSGHAALGRKHIRHCDFAPRDLGLKNARRLAPRHDKTADSYLGFIHIVSIRLWTRQFVNAS